MPQYAVNKQTGERLELRNGEWVPVESDKIPEEVQTPQEPEGSSFGRFVSGLWETTGKPALEAIPAVASAIPEIMQPIGIDEGGLRLGKGPQLVYDMLKGTAGAQKEQFLKAIEQDLSTPEGRLQAGGHGLASLIPFIGPAAAEAGERISSGDVAGGLGEGAGLILPFARPFKSARVAGRVAERLRTGAGKNVVRALGGRPKDVPNILKNAETISEGIGVGGREALRDRAVLATKAAKKKLEAFKAENPDIPIDVAAVAERANKNLPEFSLPEQVVKRVEDMSPAELQEYLKGAPTKGGRIQLPDEAPAVETTGTMYPELVGAQKNLTARLQDYAKRFEDSGFEPGKVPSNVAFEMRTGLGQKAAKGGAFKKSPLHEVGEGAQAAANVYSELTTELKNSIDGLAKVDAPYATWREAGDILEEAARKDVSRLPAWEILAGRGALEGIPRMARLGGGAAMVGTGLLAGGLPGTIIGGYGAWRIAADIVASPFFQSLSASQKLKLAKMLKEGSLAKATIAGSSTGRALEEEEQ